MQNFVLKYTSKQIDFWQFGTLYKYKETKIKLAFGIQIYMAPTQTFSYNEQQCLSEYLA